ncbi:MATE family efflux transporter [Mycolicibacterium sp. P9-22]|uniref:MATE family efflux transporter n=1 Tax=Mycolicibacterium sp. P9-22 TaxID=2024613 RepID=UPI001D13FC6F|nr:MATE family efflux transporter [Mycolicibacterium sp. P9-22]
MMLRKTLRDSRLLVSLSAPIAGIQLAQVALTTTDLLMMGLISVQAIAAGGLAITLYNQIRTMCVGTVTAVSNLVAMSVGRGQSRGAHDGFDDQTHDEVRRIVRSGLLVATLVGLAAAGVLTALSFALAWLGQDAQVLALAQPMMIALAFGLIPMLWLNVLRQFAVGMRRPGSLMWVTIGSIGVNAALNAAFIYGWLGLPALGLTGVGLATAMVNLLTCAAYYGIVRRDHTLAQFVSVRFWRADTHTTREILRLGIPISLTYGSEAGIFSVAALIMGTFGPATLAAHNVVIQLTYIAFQIAIGLSHGASTLVSGTIGQGNPSEARRIARTAHTLGALVMAVIGAVYLVAPQWVLYPFLDPAQAADVLPIAQTLLYIAVLQQLFDCAQNIGVGLLRGLSDTRSGFRITLVGYWVLGLPVLLVCAYPLGLGGYGVWLGLSAGLALTAWLLHRRFIAGLSALPDQGLRARPGSDVA